MDKLARWEGMTPPVLIGPAMTAVESRCAIIELVADLFPPQDQDRWMLTPHSALGGDWPALAMQKGNEEAVYRLLLRIRRGH